MVEQFDRLVAAANQGEAPHVLAFAVIRLSTTTQRSDTLGVRIMIRPTYPREVLGLAVFVLR